MKSDIIPFALFFVALAAVVTSCKKDDENTTSTPTVTATITVDEPLAGTTYALGDTVFVHVNITCPTEMHGYDAYILNETSGDTVWTSAVHDHGTSFHIDSLWVNDVTDHSDMLLHIEAEIDHDGNTTEKEVAFHCHPM